MSDIRLNYCSFEVDKQKYIIHLCWLLQLLEDKKGNKANAFLSPLSKNEADEIFIWIFPKYEGGKMVIKYGSCTACTYFDCAKAGMKNIALLARFTEAFAS